MTLNGKRDGFSLADFEQCAEAVSMKRGRAAAIIEEVRDAVAEWPVYAGAAGVDPSDIARIARAQRQSLARRRAEPEIRTSALLRKPVPKGQIGSRLPSGYMLLIRLSWAVGFG